MHYLELVQAALHRHKYTYFSDFNSDVVQLLLCLHPGNSKKNLIEANKSHSLTWNELKNLKMKLILLYQHYVKRDNHYMIMFLVNQLLLSIAPLSPLKSGPTVPSVIPVHDSTTAHKAVYNIHSHYNWNSYC